MKKIQKPMFDNPTLETKKRILETLDLLRKGKSRAKILKQISEKYDIGGTEAYKILHDALYRIQEADDVIDDLAETTRLVQRERLEEIIEKSLEANNYSTAMRAIDMINRLENLYVEKQEVTVTNDVIKFNFGTDD